MDLPTPDEFIRRVSDLGLAERRRIEQARNELGVGDHSLKEVINVLQRNGIVTTLQTEKILKGDKSGFYYGDYKVLYVIGAGTFARVYRAQLGDEVFAVKVLRKRFRDEAKELEQFLREGRMGLKLRHPNIVSIVDVVPDVRNPFLVMEFVEGQTLRELVRIRGKLPGDLSLRLMHEISSGLAHAASFGISHRDLKLSNVLISADGKAKLVDFGLAAATVAEDSGGDDLTNPRTIDYAGLEKATGCGKDDPRSDIFFNGCMFYQMLCGESPIPFGDRMARMNNSRFSNIKPIVDVDPEIPGVIAKVVGKAIKLDVEKRYQTQKEMLVDMKMVGQLIKNGKLDKADAVLDLSLIHI